MADAPTSLPFYVYDHTQHATWGVEPGFYWAMGIDEEGLPISEDDVPTIIGPFETVALTIEDAKEFIRDAVEGATDALEQHAA